MSLVCGPGGKSRGVSQPEELGYVVLTRAGEGGFIAAVLDSVDRAVLLQGGHGTTGYNVWLLHAAGRWIDANGESFCREGNFEGFRARALCAASFIQEGMPPQNIHGSYAGNGYAIVFLQFGKIRRE